MSARELLREHRPSILVTTLATTFGVALVGATRVLDQALRADPVAGDSATVGQMLGVVAVVVIGIALYVGAVVTANTFATIVAGRTSTIALMRLLGSSSRQQRRAVAGEGLVVGLVGAALGALLGSVLVVVAVAVLVGRGTLPDLPYSVVSATTLAPAVVVVATTLAAAWVGSRKVLAVTPLQAIGTAQEAPAHEAPRRVLRTVASAALVVGGGALLAAGVVTGLADATGVVVAFLGGVVSFTGVVVGAHLVMPLALRGVGRLAGGGAVARLAAENAVRHPERSTRATVGIVIGVTLVSTLAVALGTLRAFIESMTAADPEYFAELDALFSTTLLVVTALVGFSALIAAVGLVNDVSLSVLQRRRELGLLRTLGATARQVRLMVLLEAAQMTVAAVLLGLLLGVVYGWAGAQSLLGSAAGELVVPQVPVGLVVALVLAAAALALVSSAVPARRATSVPPVVATAVA
ncbi:putative ABC transport system permease protein [Frigoribacterium sp. PvP120]|uniref:ABC transporter permease n=1 Tax=unclassified Frigoribacterium TaxID=2627005 RepID=UPI001AE2563F|nr:ABC transporter permease [Frigoribacterium sp. PvP121]MBP1240472.1 putative ABC transport system permease protein [Frigoribacterium sp. PvP121]